MRKINKKELMKWVTTYFYDEEDGIGTCKADIFVRPKAKDMKYTFDHLTSAEKKDIMCTLIEKVGYPCEDYAEDFDDEDSPFSYTCSWDEERGVIHFAAEFRV